LVEQRRQPTMKSPRKTSVRDRTTGITTLRAALKRFEQQKLYNAAPRSYRTSHYNTHN